MALQGGRVIRISYDPHRRCRASAVLHRGICHDSEPLSRPNGSQAENATYLTTHCYNLILVIFSFSYLIVRKWCTNGMTRPKVILLSFGRYYCGCPITTGCGQSPNVANRSFASIRPSMHCVHGHLCLLRYALNRNNMLIK
ncbi:Uncharacterised protein [Yersinia pekkanenii]|uniref:Uncharacterized protein n=1 Tax=Yersinia pekkanenii TaxID=1288385 RepID=A0A0T9RUU8_9GAMM|nr:Uncharacterised protein [Yersinia pekkanenii]